MATRNYLFLCVAVFFLPFVMNQQVPDEDWGYVDVRPSAHMFWWLYGQQNSTSRATAPLIMWLQGGPGASSTGYGNFAEIGPLDVNLKPRPYTWAKLANLIFVDNPVGSGYSYVDISTAYTTDEIQIANDLLTLFKAFLKKYPLFQTTPFFIFSESYGGKMASSFAAALFKAVKQNELKCNFQAVALGDSWIDPLKFLDAWIDPASVRNINLAINSTHAAMAAGQYSRATSLWGTVEGLISAATYGVDWYNILDRSGDDDMVGDHMGVRGYLKLTAGDTLSDLMNGPIKKKLGIPSSVTWGGQSNAVFQSLSNDFMQSVVPTVDELLAAGVRVVVYSGNLDLICCTPGTLAWMDELKWEGYSKWYATSRAAFNVHGIVSGYEKTYSNLRMFFLFASGHMVPSDQPEVSSAMVSSILSHKL